MLYLSVQATRRRADARPALDNLQAQTAYDGPGVGSCGRARQRDRPQDHHLLRRFLPQLLDDSAPAAPQVLGPGALFGLMAVCSDSCWALMAAGARDWFARGPKRLDHLGASGGVMMIDLGATLATTGSS